MTPPGPSAAAQTIPVEVHVDGWGTALKECNPNATVLGLIGAFEHEWEHYSWQCLGKVLRPHTRVSALRAGGTVVIHGNIRLPGGGPGGRRARGTRAVRAPRDTGPAPYDGGPSAPGAPTTPPGAGAPTPSPGVGPRDPTNGSQTGPPPEGQTIPVEVKVADSGLILR
jgi:hypothetical protein